MGDAFLVRRVQASEKALSHRHQLVGRLVDALAKGHEEDQLRGISVPA
jgi:hypothetical protein